MAESVKNTEYVNFYKGTQENFSKLTTYQPGAFYLTTDSERLYFANGANSILDLNQYVIFVNDISSLPSDHVHGDIYYCVQENVLCTWSKDKNGWIQININTDTITTKLETEKDVADDGSNVITWTFTLYEKTSSTIDEEEKTKSVSWTITQDDIYDIIPEPKVDLTTYVDSSGAIKIHTEGDGSLQDETKHGATFIPGENIAFDDQGNNVIEISAAQYSLSSAAGSTAIHLEDNGIGDKNTFDVTLAAGHQLKIDGQTKDKITYAHGDITSTKSNGTSTPGSGAWSSVLGYVESLDTHNGAGESTSTDGNGHVFGYKMAQVTLPDEPQYKTKAFRIGSKADSTEAGSLYFQLKDESATGSGNTLEGEISKGLYYGIKNDDGQVTKYYNTQTLPVYTIEQINTRLKGLNAVTYKGTVNHTNKPLPKENVHIGDAYMATTIGDYGDATTKFIDAEGNPVTGILEHVEAGDLFIATGTEKEATGVNPDGSSLGTGFGEIVSGTLVWTYVPAGNDYDSKYYLDHTNNTVTLKGNTTDNPDMPGFNGSIEFAVNHTENDDILVETSSTNPTGKTNPGVDDIGKLVTVKYKHKEYGETCGTGNAAPDYNESVSFKVIDEVTNGHVSAHKTLTIAMPAPQDVTILSKADEPTIYLQDSWGASDGHVTFVDDTETVGTTTTKIIEALPDGANKIKFKHRRGCATQTTTGTAKELTWSSKTSWIESLTPTPDGDGHIKQYVTTQYTMPDDPSIEKIELTNTNTDEHNISIKQTVTSPNGMASSIATTTKLQTNTDSLVLNTTKSSTTKNNQAVDITVDLVWKSF